MPDVVRGMRRIRHPECGSGLSLTAGCGLIVQILAKDTVDDIGGLAMKIVRWGILGPGAIAQNFADGLAQCDSGTLAAIASRSAERRVAFGTRNDVPENARFDTCEGLCASDVDAVYISTPHPFHAEPALMAIRAGKAVVVEKPAGLNLAEVQAITDAAGQEQVFFMEAYMYRCHPQIARTLALIAQGAIGTVRHITARFGFAATPDPDHRLFSPALAGGAILDVGGYPMSFVRLIAGSEPLTLRGTGIIGDTGVDERAHAVLTFAGGITAEIACAITREMDNAAVIEGTTGTLTLPDPWTPGRDAGPSDAVIRIASNGETREEHLTDARMLFAHEAEAASRAIAAQLTQAPAPAMTWADSLGNNAALDAWRREVGHATFAEAPGVLRVLPRTLPAGLPRVPDMRIDGLARPLNTLIMGCDNRDTPAEGAIVWDAWMEAGGYSFDTAFVYGGGAHEAVLGQWIASRGVADDITVIAKGAHSPYCLPAAIAPQLEISLDRLGLAHVPVYILHRDNPDVPVGEFVDAIAALRDAGRIGIWGGSNWMPERFAAACDYAAGHGLEPPRILNNNLSLAVMEKPVWSGCVTSNTPASLAFLRTSGAVHLSWSSQARGYFLPAALRNRLPPDIGPETCFGSPANAERRTRAETLAAERGVSAHNVATAWVLAQGFPSAALIGPRSPDEIASTLPGLTLALTAAEVAWLNLERDSR